VKNRNEHSSYARELVSLLTEDNLALIDFDKLRDWLGEMAPVLEEVVRLREDLSLLRQDYIGRITGMTKAIAAVKRRPDGWETALAYIEMLPSLSAAELIEHYRKTSARFRDAFPTSFGLLGGRNRGGDGLRDAGVYK
jgi:hypothetical protein